MSFPLSQPVPVPAPLQRWTLFLADVDIPDRSELEGSRRNRAHANTAHGYRRVRFRWEDILRDWVRREQIPRPLERRFVRFERRFVGKAPPRAEFSLRRGVGPIVDAFLHAELILDNEPRWFAYEIRQARVTQRPGLVVRMELRP